MMPLDNQSIILIDDECAMCTKLIRWIAKADTKDRFLIAGLESKFGKSIIRSKHIQEARPDSLILIEAGKVYYASDAVLKISEGVKSYQRLGKIYRFLPSSLRNWIYFFISKRRYILFGKAKQCSMDPALLKKVIRD